MKELSASIQHHSEEFKAVAEEVIVDVETQVAGFEDFTAQQQKVQGLANRVVAGRERIVALDSRMNQVQEKVQYWERAEAEWKENTRKRLQRLWVVMTVICVCVLGLVAILYYKPFKDASRLRDATPDSYVTAIAEMEKMRNGSNDAQDDLGEQGLMANKMQSLAQHHPEPVEDVRLRLLDEL